MPVQVGKNFAADCDTFYWLWEKAKDDPDRIHKIPHLSIKQVKGLHKRGLFTEAEFAEAKKLYCTDAFRVEDFTQDELKSIAFMLKNRGYIRYVKDIDAELAERWLKYFEKETFDATTIMFVMRSQAFTLDQKIRMIYLNMINKERMSFGYQQQFAKRLLKCADKYCEDSYKIFLALTTKLDITLAYESDITRDMIIQAFDFSFRYQQYRILRVLKYTICGHRRYWENRANQFFYDLIDTEDDIFNVGYQNEPMSKSLVELVSHGMITKGEIDQCHLGHLLPNSQAILENL